MLKRLILLCAILVALGVNAIKAQENTLSFSIGYPINLTDHWLVNGWNNKINVNTKFIRKYNLLAVGAGLNYSAYDVDKWFRYYQSEKKSIADLSPYVLIGININNNKISILPHTNIGYSFILSDIELYRGSNGLYVAPGLDISYALMKNIKNGLNVNYNYILSDLDLNTDGWIVHQDFVRETDDIMKSLTFDVNLAYKLGN